MLQICFVCITILLIATGTVTCKPDYFFSGGWLKLQTTPATWEEALVRCHDEGAVLASPLDKQLVTALQSLMILASVSQRIYLGSYDFDSLGYFGSLEGVRQSDMEIKWGAHPNNSGGNCLTMSIDGYEHYIYKSSCLESLPYICYKKLDCHTMNECGTFDNEYHLNQRTGSCYKVHEEKMNWVAAKRTCVAEGGNLVILNDKEEARVVKDMFPVRSGAVDLTESFYVGLRSWGSDRTWMTVHSDRMEDVFNNWLPGQPENGNQNVGTFNRAGALDDVQYLTEKMFVCEKSPKSRCDDSQPCEESKLSINVSCARGFAPVTACSR